jgi:predicted nucleotidyltransferase
MNDLIIQKLHEIEQTEQIKILLAVESGSRAWGFASPDSDYDVRFIYVRPRNEYLKLNKNRDVIELPINDLLDINGWDLDKTLTLLYKSNPTLFEWFSSPIVYMDSEFTVHFKRLMLNYFSTKHSLYHYISMAESNYRAYLREDMVKAKKYFYVLRPVLACQWILDRGTPPPMLFAELKDAELPEPLQNDVDRLLDIKMNAPELKVIPRVNAINDYLDKTILEIRDRIASMPDERDRSWSELNQLFLQTLADYEV